MKKVALGIVKVALEIKVALGMVKVVLGFKMNY